MAYRSNAPYLIAETAWHHQGEFDFQQRIIREIAELGADAIKLHITLDLGTYFTSRHPLIHQQPQWMFTAHQWRQHLNLAFETGLDVVVLANDAAAIELVRNEYPETLAIELHAVALNDLFLLRALEGWPNKVMLGTGGSTLDEIAYALEVLAGIGITDVLLMHGFQNYPTDYRSINLARMRKLHDLFGLPIGYADHTNPTDPHHDLVCVLAAAQGFFTLEKHYTPVPGEERIDHHAAISAEQFLRVRELLHLVHTTYGHPLALSAGERKYGETGPMKKAIVAARALPAGHVLQLEDLAFRRTDEVTFMRQNQFLQLVGLETRQAIAAEDIVDFSKVHFKFQAPSAADFGA